MDSWAPFPVSRTGFRAFVYLAFAGVDDYSHRVCDPEVRCRRIRVACPSRSSESLIRVARLPHLPGIDSYGHCICDPEVSFADAFESIIRVARPSVFV